MDPLDYLHLQLRLEGNAIVHGSFIRQVEVVPGEEPPLVLLALLASGQRVIFYNECLSSDLIGELAAKTIPLIDLEPLADVLRAQGISFAFGHYKTYVFPAQPARDGEVLCLSREDARVKAFGFDRFAENVYAIEREGALVSACTSARENEDCAEAWVYTAPEYRGQGLAQKVVNVWGGSRMDAGKIPFYSHGIENQSSARLAEQLGLQTVFEQRTIVPVR